MGFYVFLEILRTFECFATELAAVRFEWNMYANVRGDVVALHGRSMTITPCTSQAEVVSTLSADMDFADVVLVS